MCEYDHTTRSRQVRQSVTRRGTDQIIRCEIDGEGHARETWLRILATTRPCNRQSLVHVTWRYRSHVETQIRKESIHPLWLVADQNPARPPFKLKAVSHDLTHAVSRISRADGRLTRSTLFGCQWLRGRDMKPHVHLPTSWIASSTFLDRPDRTWTTHTCSKSTKMI